MMFSCVLLNATEWEVNAGSYYYSPSVLEIYVGDTVTWVNDGGYHDVNAFVNAVTGLVYENPENFSLAPTTGPLIGSYTFTVAEPIIIIVRLEVTHHLVKLEQL